MMRRVMNCGFFAARRFSVGSENRSGNHLNEWIKINKEMEQKAADIAGKEIQIRTSTLQGEIYGVKEQIAGLRSDFRSLENKVGQDIRALESKMGQDFRVFEANMKAQLAAATAQLSAETAGLHKQQTNGLRIMLVSLFGVASGAVGINNYLQSNRDSENSAAAPRGMASK